jgi:hypothetical protein
VEVIDKAVQNSTVNKEIKPNESIIETMLVEDEESDSDEGLSVDLNLFYINQICYEKKY